MKNTTRANLSEAVYKELGFSYVESDRLVEQVLTQMTDSFAKGEDVKISSFASFCVHKKARRMGRNPKNGKPYEISARSILSFYPSTTLKRKVAKKQNS